MYSEGMQPALWALRDPGSIPNLFQRCKLATMRGVISPDVLRRPRCIDIGASWYWSIGAMFGFSALQIASDGVKYGGENG